MLEYIEKNVLYLKRNIPPDDIYMFAEQTLMAALFFLSRWHSNLEDNTPIIQDPIACKYVNNILGLIRAREKDEDVSLNLNLESLDEDNP